jgi:hypothetical protein
MNDSKQERPSTGKVPLLFRASLCSLLLATLLWIAFDMLSAHEQAQSPGEKSLGVAALAILCLPPILFFGAVGAGTAIVTGSVLLYRKLSGRHI